MVVLANHYSTFSYRRRSRGLNVAGYGALPGRGAVVSSPLPRPDGGSISQAQGSGCNMDNRSCSQPGYRCYCGIHRALLGRMVSPRHPVYLDYHLLRRGVRSIHHQAIWANCSSRTACKNSLEASVAFAAPLPCHVDSGTGSFATQLELTCSSSRPGATTKCAAPCEFHHKSSARQSSTRPTSDGA